MALGGSRDVRKRKSGDYWHPRSRSPPKKPRIYDTARHHDNPQSRDRLESELEALLAMSPTDPMRGKAEDRVADLLLQNSISDIVRSALVPFDARGVAADRLSTAHEGLINALQPKFVDMLASELTKPTQLRNAVVHLIETTTRKHGFEFNYGLQESHRYPSTIAETPEPAGSFQRNKIIPLRPNHNAVQEKSSEDTARTMVLTLQNQGQINPMSLHPDLGKQKRAPNASLMAPGSNGLEKNESPQTIECPVRNTSLPCSTPTRVKLPIGSDPSHAQRPKTVAEAGLFSNKASAATKETMAERHRSQDRPTGVATVVDLTNVSEEEDTSNSSESESGLDTDSSRDSSSEGSDSEGETGRVSPLRNGDISGTVNTTETPTAPTSGTATGPATPNTNPSANITEQESLLTPHMLRKKLARSKTPIIDLIFGENFEVHQYNEEDVKDAIVNAIKKREPPSLVKIIREKDKSYDYRLAAILGMRHTLATVFDNHPENLVLLRRALDEALQPLVRHTQNKKAFPELRDCFFMEQRHYPVYELLRLQDPSLPEPVGISDYWREGNGHYVISRLLKLLKHRVAAEPTDPPSMPCPPELRLDHPDGLPKLLNDCFLISHRSTAYYPDGPRVTHEVEGVLERFARFRAGVFREVRDYPFMQEPLVMPLSRPVRRTKR